MTDQAPKISTAKDFLRIKDERRRAQAKPLTLPSGLTILAYRPPPEWWIRNIGRMPQSITARLHGAEPVASNDEDTIKTALLTVSLIQEVVVSPTIKLGPGPGELDPSDITNEDLTFIMRFGGGEIDATGQDLDTFSGESGPAAGTGARGTTLGS